MTDSPLFGFGTGGIGINFPVARAGDAPAEASGQQVVVAPAGRGIPTAFIPLHTEPRSNVPAAIPVMDSTQGYLQQYDTMQAPSQHPSPAAAAAVVAQPIAVAAPNPAPVAAAAPAVPPEVAQFVGQPATRRQPKDVEFAIRSSLDENARVDQFPWTYDDVVVTDTALVFVQGADKRFWLPAQLGPGHVTVQIDKQPRVYLAVSLGLEFEHDGRRYGLMLIEAVAAT